MWVAYREDRICKDITGQRQLFFDFDTIACTFQVTRRFHHPKKHGANPLVVADKSWEEFPYFRGNSYSVVREPGEGQFHCWYEDIQNFYTGCDKSMGLREHLLYAVSDDGIHWKKPTFKKWLVDGQPTNTVYGYPPYEGGRMSDPSVLLDPLEADASKRFKMIYWDRGAEGRRNSPYPLGNLCIAYSPDGIDWRPYEGNPVIPDWGGDMQQVSYDPYDGKFVCYGRARPHHSLGYPGVGWEAPTYPSRPEGVWGTARKIYRCESPDLIHWSEPVLVHDPNILNGDNLDDEHYGFIAWRPTEEVHLGILDKFHFVDNTVDNYLFFSANGEQWNRFMMPEPFIPRGPEGSYDCYDAETGLAPIEVGDELWFYYGGGKVHHDWWIRGQQEGLDVPEAIDPSHARNGYGLCLATMRRDGYCSLDATIREGFVETKPIWSNHPVLLINGECKDDGYILVEVINNWGQVYKGFDRESCIPFTGDEVSHCVAWEEHRDGMQDIGGFFKLRFHLKNASLFGFDFVPER